MVLNWIDWTIIILFLALFLWVGISFRKSASKGLENFFLGGRNIPWFIAGTSMVATTFAADTPLAVTELVHKNGISGNWLWWCFLSGGMLTTIFFAKYWRRANILTELELIEIRYSGKAARFLRNFKALYLGLFMNAMIIGWVNLAFVSILTVFFGISPTTALVCTFATMLLAVVYSSLSGLLGVAMTDLIQFVVALTGCIVLAVIVLNSNEVGGMSALKANLPDAYFQFFPSFTSGDALTTNTLALSIGAFLSYFAVQWWASWYPGAEPGGGGYVAQRMMSTRTEKDSVFATLLFQVAHYCIRPWPWIIVGLCALYLYGGNYGFETESSSLVAQYQLEEYAKNPRLGFVYIMRDFLPTGIKGLLLVAFIAAYLSTISTQLNWGASFIVNDFLLPLKIIRDKSDRELVTASRWVTLALMVIGVAVTTFLESISGVWEFILECGAGLGLVLILRWYWWRINAWSELTASIAPFFAYAISKVFLEDRFGASFIENKGTFLFTVGFTTISWLMVTFLTKPTHHGKLQSFYEKVRPLGAWKNFNEGNANNGQLLWLVVAWLSAVSFVYSILFSSGYVLFLEYRYAVNWAIAGIAGFILLRFSLKKAKFF